MRASKQGTVGNAEKTALERRADGSGFERGSVRQGEVPDAVRRPAIGPQAPCGGPFAGSGSRL
ncbi:hypothetical protein BO443_170095 [Burkholderia orbicola]